MIEIIQILSACICGVAVGIERQHFGSSAGVRTYALVCVGACLYGIISTHAQGAAYYESIVDPTRIAAQVVTGVGFIGGGIIFKDTNRIRGLTTAATVWIMASVGLAFAFEIYLIPIITTFMVIFILTLNRWPFFNRLGEKHGHDHDDV
jgi:putative Mg2+ transporter-C (MgtC) family protein